MASRPTRRSTRERCDRPRAVPARLVARTAPDETPRNTAKTAGRGPANSVAGGTR